MTAAAAHEHQAAAHGGNGSGNGFDQHKRVIEYRLDALDKQVSGLRADVQALTLAVNRFETQRASAGWVMTPLISAAVAAIVAFIARRLS